MKKLIIVAIGVLFSFSIYAKNLQELVLTVNPPMHCQNCENKIKGNIRFEKGVKKIETSIENQTVTIEYDADKIDPEQIENAFKKIGYDTEIVNKEGETTSKVQSCGGTEGSCCKKE